MIKIGAKFFALLGSFIVFIGLLLLAKYATSVGIIQFIGMTIIVSSGIILMNVSLINLLIFSVEREVMGIATGTNSLFRNFGATWGPAIAGTIMTTYATFITVNPSQTIIFRKTKLMNCCLEVLLLCFFSSQCYLWL